MFSATFLLFFLLVMVLASCKKKNEDESSPVLVDHVDRIDRLNFIIVDGDTIYHRIVKDVTFRTKWDFKFFIRTVNWWNLSPYRYVSFDFSTNSGVYGHFGASISINDTTFLSGRNETPVPIKREVVGGKELFTFEDVKMYANYPHDSSYFLMSGQCTN